MSNESTTNNEWQAREIGALWKKDGQNQKYLSGKVKLPEGAPSEFGVVVFTNRHKAEGSNQPDFRLYLDSKSVPEEGSQTEQVAEETVEEGIL